jgi:hypothetical protein
MKVLNFVLCPPAEQAGIYFEFCALTFEFIGGY